MEVSFLSVFQFSKNNFGSSTGSEWLHENQPKYIESYSPVDGSLIARVATSSKKQFDTIIHQAELAFEIWKNKPAPQRGQIIYQIGEALRRHKKELGQLVSFETGKSLQEGQGEVQEMIDICDFAVGLSRQLHGFTMHSERASHRMYEQYHPLGIVGIISAFNFPVAVWAWNAMISWVCGNVCIWKPSEKAPLSALACQKIIAEVFQNNKIPEGVSNLIIGDYKVGEWMSDSPKLPLISATGSTRMGKAVAQKVASRLGKSLLELGGNNAVILTPSSNLILAVPAVVFGAVGTAGQRCTSTRRLIIHKSIYTQVKKLLVSAYRQIKIGNPLDPKNHVGPLIDLQAVAQYKSALAAVQKEGGKIIFGNKILEGENFASGCYVLPTIVEAKPHFKMVQEETFAPILYLIAYSELSEAIAIQNQVTQGLSSAIFTDNLQEAEIFLSQKGSDCGIANVNIGTSGAEIGGAFGGEKATGGGRESGSDAWKYYMRRQTNTINYGNDLPLAQGIQFHL